MVEFTFGIKSKTGNYRGIFNRFQINSLGFSCHQIYSFLKLDNSSIKANIKLACEHRVKQFSVIQVCINLRGFLIELSLRFSVGSHVSSTETFQGLPLFVVSNLTGTDVQVAD